MKKGENYLCMFLIFLFLSPTLYAAPTVYIPLGSANKVIAVNASTDQIIATYTGILNPHGLVATPDGEYLIAGSLNETPLTPKQSQKTANSLLYLVHPEHGHVMSTIAVAGWTHHQAITPNGQYVISTHPAKGTVTVVDLKSNRVIETIQTGQSPNYTVITKDGTRAYVTNSGSNNISEIDLSTWKVIRTLESGPSPEHLTFSGDESTLLVGNPRAGTASVIFVKSGKLIETYLIGDSVHGLDIGDDGKTLFVSSKKSELVVAIDTLTGKKRELKLSPAPYHLNTIRGTGKIYLSSRNQPIIWVIDQKTLQVINTIELPGGEGHQMAVVD